MKQEKLDAEFALSLQSGTPLNPSAAARPVAPSAFDRLTGMRPPPSSSVSSRSAQNARTSSSRTLPWAKNSASTVIFEPPSMLWNTKREEPSSSYGMGSYSNSDNMNGFKSEPSPSRTMPGAFVDDYSTASDSDIEIIPPESFHDNGRHVSRQNGPGTSLLGGVYGTPQPRMQHPSFSAEAQTAGEVALRRVEQASTNNALQMAMYGTQNVLNNALPLPNSSQSLPGSYPHPGIGVSNNSAYGTLPTYGGGAGSFVYPSATLGGGGLSRNYGGMYPGYASGNMQNVGPF
jgi:hypothetical protein